MGTLSASVLPGASAAGGLFDIYDGFLLGWLALAAATFVLLFVIDAPYGRHVRKGWGPTVSPRLGWVLMESPTLILFNIIAFTGVAAVGSTTTGTVLWVLWHLHYVNRTIVYPLRMSASAKPMPMLVVVMGFIFQTGNCVLQAGWIYTVSGGYADSWMRSDAFIIGVALFVLGFWLNLNSDAILRRLREPGETGYKIPQGGGYRWVSSPNYLGEIIEWAGWAIATWSVAGAAFAVWTAANLVPRALANHRWYRDKFPDYPKQRRAILPWLL